MTNARRNLSAATLALLACVLPASAFAQGGADKIQHIRPLDQTGVNVFESPKQDTTKYSPLHTAWGAAFTQDFQNLTHQTTSVPKVVSGVDQNKLMPIGPGFNNAMANLYMNTQLAPGIRVALTSYLSTRHHNETWVKDGYFLIDASPWDIPALNEIMKYATLRVGHFEVNYGDQHFRRSDAGNAIYNPFVGNLIMDAFTTEIGAELYLRNGPWMAMGGITGGEIRGTVEGPGQRAPTYLGKLGFDQQVTSDFRFRLTGSTYITQKSQNNTLYSGDRGGSHYFDVMENASSTTTSNAWSGEIQPGLRSKVHAFVLNPFIKYQGLELFGNIETVTGSAATETSDRTWRQLDGEVVYRFFPEEQMYVGYRYNTAKGELVGMPGDVGADRWSLAGGWFVTKNVLAKFEYTNQVYNNFPVTDIRNGGKFKGFMVEGVVGF